MCNVLFLLLVGTEDLIHRWSTHVRGVHDLKTSGLLNEESYNNVMDLFEKKVTSTYNKRGYFWATIRDLEEVSTVLLDFSLFSFIDGKIVMTTNNLTVPNRK